MTTVEQELLPIAMNKPRADREIVRARHDVRRLSRSIRQIEGMIQIEEEPCARAIMVADRDHLKRKRNAALGDLAILVRSGS